MILDFLQYVSGYQAVQNALHAPRQGDGGGLEYEYEYTTFVYRAQSWCFWGKQVLVMVSFGCLAYALGAAMLAC
jgi:hypothetical protein